MKIRELRERRDGCDRARRSASASLFASWTLPLLLTGPLALLSEIPAAALEVHVNYAHDWVGGTTDAGVEVAIQVKDSVDDLKGETTVWADGFGNFFADCPAYAPDPCPDIVPGDTVIVDVPGLQHTIAPVGWIEGIPDESEETVSGILDADWLTGPVPVRCEVWGPPGPPTIDTSADPDGGTFWCDFDDVGWDLQRGDILALTYFEPDGDRVTNVVVWPWIRVNATHDWVGGNCAAGHTVTVTAMESDGLTVKADAHVDTALGGGWGESGFQTEPWHWSPGLPDIMPGDHVEVELPPGGITTTVQVGTIAAVVDVDADTVGGTLDADWLTGPVQIECHPWGAGFPVPIKIDSVEPDGVATFTCDWSGEWDMLPGQDVGVMYIEPGVPHRVIEVFREPAPHLAVGKWAQGSPAAGGNFVFTINYHNAGDAPAEDVTITDTMDILVGETPVPGGMVYLSDSSGLPHTGSGNGPIEWQVGTLDPGQGGGFELYVAVTPSVGEIVRNTALIDTTSDDSGPPDEKTAMWEGTVLDNDTHVGVGKNSWVPDPAPGEQVVFSINVCNLGQTGSTQLTLVDTMSAGLTLDTWWATSPGWTEESIGSEGFTLTRPSIPGGSCHEVLVRADVGPDVVTDTPLFNTAAISATNDMESEDNESTWQGPAGEPHLNLWIVKRLNRGVLVPGGELIYNVSYGNNGNQTAASVRIVDTLPPGTTFVSSWHSGFLGDYEIVPIINEPEHVVWQLPEVPPGMGGNIEAHLAIDPAALPGTVMTNEIEICGPPEAEEPCAPIPGEDTYDDNSSSWTEVLNPPGPNLRLMKRSAWQDSGALRYILRFQNIGDQTIPGVAISDTVPAGTFWYGWWDMAFDPARLVGDPAFDGGILTWSFSELHPGENGRVRFNAVLDGSQQPLAWIDNYAQITIPGGDTNPDDNFDITTDLWGNQCSGEHVLLLEETYAGDFWCLAPGSITASSVTITGTGGVILRAPLVVFENGLAVEPGGTLSAGTP